MSTTLTVASLVAVVLSTLVLFTGTLRYVIDAHRTELREMRAERAALLREFAVERSELLVRIQHPSVIVPPRPEAPEPAASADPDADEFARVGTITFDAEDADLVGVGA